VLGVAGALLWLERGGDESEGDADEEPVEVIVDDD